MEGRGTTADRERRARGFNGRIRIRNRLGREEGKTARERKACEQERVSQQSDGRVKQLGRLFPEPADAESEPWKEPSDETRTWFSAQTHRSLKLWSRSTL
eukprot:1388108-Rhodomonas_salina.3